jgi:carboxylesterase
MSKLQPSPHPARTYDEAVARVEALWNRPIASPLLPVSRTIFLSHGERTKRGIVFLHGYTNSPHQFRMLGERFHARGFNVLIPRMPHHGIADRLTDDLRHLSAETLIETADIAIDAAAGFADEITVMGLSMGGVLTAWTAQTRPEVNRAVIISPAFGADAIPNWLIPPLSQLFGRLPNRYLWWGEENVVEDIQPHTYPRMASRGLAAFWRLGVAVRKLARKQKPVADQIIVVLNQNDKSIDYQMALDMEALWRKKQANVRRFDFLEADQLEHDIIDPENPLANTDLVNPILESLVG